ncbi:hypothetical protein H634G_01905 [Metarhizium anisopliae BRIP 53293]|uniref:Uncharacterized protein n=1 Tax=Metarhizium anisopliae BRIP 53293 TaxID=1291518 RepID=A0A0D9P9E3_METAN|nr:hypothetical protein H634G_01905 [Metarhizium anisopliae BRIP 53293]KJK93402.1 hypothetical protein H633G_02603 [Metarhizium anisopliae BRIP 53284]
MSGFQLDSKTYNHHPTHVVDESESPSSNPVEYKRRGIFSPSEWLLEMLSTIGSLVCLAAIITIFWNMDNKPLSAWNSIVSLNAAISILTTAHGAALMHGVGNFIGQIKWLHFKEGVDKLENLQKFDEASRGPWGSFMFLATVKPNLATLGALITIARFALSPLTQQVVKIEQQLVPKGNAVFGYAHEYNRGLILANNVPDSIPQDPGLQVAILRGLYNISSPEVFSCSGECRWEGRYISLGFKTECTNVTRATLDTSQCAKAYDNPSLTLCNMTTPSGLGISTRYAETDLTTTYFMNVSSRWESDDELRTRLPEIARFALYRSTSDDNFNAWDVNITDCSLSLAAYEYTNARANGSAFSFEQTREVEPNPKNPWDYITDDDGMKSPARVQLNTSKVQGTPALAISLSDLSALSVYLESDSIASEWVSGNWVNKNSGLSAALSGNVDVGKRFEMMALSMTSYLRSGPNSIPAAGTSFSSQPFVSARWPYLIGPGIIQSAALLFTMMTIAGNRKSRNVPLWKSSALAVLACHYDSQSGKIQANGMTVDMKEMEKTAEKSLAQLE